MSAWQFLAAPLACALLIGSGATGIVSPLSSVMLSRAENLDNQYLRTSGGPLALQGGQLWLRQADHELDPAGVAILHARAVSLVDGALKVSDLSIFRLSADDKLLSRVEATSARLENGAWVLDGARTMVPDHLPEPVGVMSLQTDLTVDRVEESFASPTRSPCGRCPISSRCWSGRAFPPSVTGCISKPCWPYRSWLVPWTLVAAGFSMRPDRRGGVAQMIGSGCDGRIHAVRRVESDGGVRSVWHPTRHAGGVGTGRRRMMLAVALLLHLEDG